MCNFPIIVEGHPSLRHIFPTKQRAVKSAIDLAKADDRIKRLIIFGSAVTMNCGACSDVDIAIDAPDVAADDFPKLAHDFYIGVDSEVDVIHYNLIHSQVLKKEIDNKGVSVYIKRE